MLPVETSRPRLAKFEAKHPFVSLVVLWIPEGLAKRAAWEARRLLLERELRRMR